MTAQIATIVQRAHFPPIPPAVKAALLPFLLSRGLIALLAAVLNQLVVLKHLPALNVIHPGAMTPLTTAWDAAWYIGIAHDGYDVSATANVQHNYQFFPLLPRLMRVIAGPGRSLDDYGLVGMVINHLAFGAALILLYQLTADVFADAGLARRAVWVLALAPGAFVCSMVYSEPLFLCCSLLAFWAAWRSGQAHRWVAVGWSTLALLGVATTTLTRAPGLALAPAISWLFFQRRPRPGGGRRLALALLPLIVTLATFGGWVLYVGWRTGSPLAALQAGPAWGPGIGTDLHQRLSSANPLIWQYGVLQVVFLGGWVALSLGLALLRHPPPRQPVLRPATSAAFGCMRSVCC